jgi:Pyruvate/2-oxoacid:ferredoxin oxidoreductase delta subunit
MTQQVLASPGQQQQQDDSSSNGQQLQLTPTSSALRRTAATLDWGQTGGESKDSCDSPSNSNSANASRTTTPRGSVTAALLSPQQASAVKLFASSSDESSDDDHVRSKHKQHGHRKVLYDKCYFCTLLCIAYCVDRTFTHVHTWRTHLLKYHLCR